MNKYKVAVCYSGMYRYMLESFNNLENHVLNGVDYDVFIHIWNKIGTSRGWDKPINMTDDVDEIELKKIKNIKGLVIEKYDNRIFLDKSKYFVNRIMNNSERVTSMFYKIYKCEFINIVI